MDVLDRRSATAGAVLLGGLLLFAPLSFVLIVAAVRVLAGIAGIDVLAIGPVGFFVVIAGALVIALDVATEAAAVRLHGFAALDRGTGTRRAIRYGSLGATVLSGLVVAVAFLLDVLGWAIANDRIDYLLISSVVAVALVWALLRVVRAFGRGYRERTIER
jgi:ethanolamine utilization microcompartment shell protein EutS